MYVGVKYYREYHQKALEGWTSRWLEGASPTGNRQCLTFAESITCSRAIFPSIESYWHSIPLYWHARHVRASSDDAPLHLRKNSALNTSDDFQLLGSVRANLPSDLSSTRHIYLGQFIWSQFNGKRGMELCGLGQLNPNYGVKKQLVNTTLLQSLPKRNPFRYIPISTTLSSFVFLPSLTSFLVRIWHSFRRKHGFALTST